MTEIPPVTEVTRPDSLPPFRSHHGLRATRMPTGGWRFENLSVSLVIPGDCLRLNPGTKVEVVVTLEADWSLTERFVGQENANDK